MAFNKNEVVLEKVRQASYYNLEDGKLELRITSIEDPSLGCTAEGEEVTDAIGSLITTIYRAKKATFGGSNSLMSFDLAAAQYGTKKEVASADNKIVNYAYEILEVTTTETGEGENKVVTVNPVKLKNVPKVDSIKYIYSIESGEIGAHYKVNNAAASENECFVADDGTITLPSAVTSGKVYVEYAYETENAVRVVNRASQFPTAGRLVILAYFRDKCTDKVYSGAVVCPKAKLNPESVELALTSTGKHPFEFTMMRDYCDELNDELFEIILSE